MTGLPDTVKNLSLTSVATAPSPAVSGTSLVVAAGEATRFPAVPFYATVWPAGALADPSNAEIVRVTAVATDTLTITRAQGGTSARSIVVGDLIAATVTAEMLAATQQGFEIDYAQITSSASITATTEATATTVVTGNAVTYDGATVVLVHFFAPGWTHNQTRNTMGIVLYDGAASIGQIGVWRSTANANDDYGIINCFARITPSAAAHTYSVRAYVQNATATIRAGTGGSGQNYPAFIRITKAG